MSEIAETISKNLDFTDDAWFDKETGSKIAKRFGKLMACLPKFNTKDATENPTEHDLEQALKEFTENQKLHQISQQLFVLGHQMFSVGLHYLVASYLFKNPPIFAEKSNLGSRNDEELKKDPTAETLKEMLKKELLSGQRNISTPVKRNLLSALESSDDEDMEPVRTPKKKKNKKSLFEL